MSCKEIDIENIDNDNNNNNNLEENKENKESFNDKICEQESWPTAVAAADIMSRDRIEKIKWNLVEDLKVSIQHIIFSILREDRAVLDSCSFGVDRLCMSIEKILTHDLHSHISLWRIIESFYVAAAVMVVDQQHNNGHLVAMSEFRDIKNSRMLFSDRGRARSYIRSLLNNNKLLSFFQSVQSVAKDFYTDTSIMLIEQHHNNIIDQVVSLFEKVGDMKFKLSLDSTTLEMLVDHTLLSSNNSDDITSILNRIDDNINNININNNSSSNEEDDELYEEMFTIKLPSKSNSNSKSTVQTLKLIRPPTPVIQSNSNDIVSSKNDVVVDDEELISQYDQDYKDIEGIQELSVKIQSSCFDQQPLSFNHFSDNTKKELIHSITKNNISVDDAIKSLNLNNNDSNNNNNNNSETNVNVNILKNDNSNNNITTIASNNNSNDNNNNNNNNNKNLSEFADKNEITLSTLDNEPLVTTDTANKTKTNKKKIIKKKVLTRTINFD
ncbi:hypothetical protein PPL_00493 [Heterostelium album PN500]|uniref:RUN domain-containing protein n=1 Tax=Heterostelium pallidum (strain ATCC 26659 / Pp 5 / PN500) TaxID=670386 RepID=D3AWL8_HETP5|nr:hypothetical protein PPL_00493 [Heterostelium album PN500]EFA86691.1 hypothetical protein PPL_00493 [Heterostelium album PN500]|eukprot:XP_020438795.1 hypothetical protein PPL_00493 [Heterostelium album PN500]